MFYSSNLLGSTNSVIGNHLVLAIKFHLEKSMKMNKIIG